jgi:hypothetical protein
MLAMECDCQDYSANHDRLSNSQIQNIAFAIPIDDLLQEIDAQNNNNHA